MVMLLFPLMYYSSCSSFFLLVPSHIVPFVHPTPFKELFHAIVVGPVASMQSLPQTIFIVVLAATTIFLTLEYGSDHEEKPVPPMLGVAWAMFLLPSYHGRPPTATHALDFLPL